eukprot:365986-Chlamydomonas_euryale.AAC.8
MSGKRVLLRADLNLPMGPDRAVADTARLDAVLPTIQLLASAGAKVRRRRSGREGSWRGGGGGEESAGRLRSRGHHAHSKSALRSWSGALMRWSDVLMVFEVEIVVDAVIVVAVAVYAISVMKPARSF